MVCPISEEELAAALQRFSGRQVYLHVEVTPGGFIRNLNTDVKQVVLRADGSSYRIAVRCAGDGWVVMEGLTHMALPGAGPLMICSLVEEDRLARVIQISEEAFPA